MKIVKKVLMYKIDRRGVWVQKSFSRTDPGFQDNWSIHEFSNFNSFSWFDSDKIEKNGSRLRLMPLTSTN